MSEFATILGRLVDSDSPHVRISGTSNIKTVVKRKHGYDITIGVDDEVGNKIVDSIFISSEIGYVGGLILIDAKEYEKQRAKENGVQDGR